MKHKTWYILRIREADTDNWGEPMEFFTRKERDSAAMYARIIGGLRTHSYDETRTATRTEGAQA